MAVIKVIVYSPQHSSKNNDNVIVQSVETEVINHSESITAKSVNSSNVIYGFGSTAENRCNSCI